MDEYLVVALLKKYIMSAGCMIKNIALNKRTENDVNKIYLQVTLENDVTKEIDFTDFMDVNEVNKYLDKGKYLPMDDTKFTLDNVLSASKINELINQLKETKVNKTDLAEGRRYKGKVDYKTTSSTGYVSGKTVLPTSENVVGDYWLVSEDNHYYQWNASSLWDDVGNGDEGYIKLDNELSEVKESVYVKSTFQLVWEVGSFGSVGEKAASLYRARVGNFYEVSSNKVYYVPQSSNYIFAIQQYGDGYEFISYVGWLPYNELYKYIPANNVKYIRLNVKRLDLGAVTNSDIDTLNRITFESFYQNRISDIEEKIERIENITNEIIVTKKPHAIRSWDWLIGQDGTMVKDKLWIFYDQNITPTIYILDLETEQADITKKHGLGHCNSVDYNGNNDCLLVYKSDRQNHVGAIIYKNPSASSNLLTTDENCITINMYNDTSYLNPTASICWGETNNIIYMIDGCYSNYSNETLSSEITISKILLGMGDNDLSSEGYGTFVSGKLNTDYNGTCKVVKVYRGEIVEGRDVIFGSNKLGTAQGMEYDGDIYVAWGFSGHNFLQIHLNDDDNTYQVVRNYMHYITDYTGANITYLEPELLALNGKEIICGSTNGSKRSLYTFQRS